MTRNRFTSLGFIVLTGVLAWPMTAAAQSAIAGVVRDASGGVLPGVTVEASSEALIEKTKVVTTDGSGQYRVVDLRPGVYTVTFSLTGFQTVRREKIELPAEFTATINSELRVGAIEETITVTGASPMVDVQRAAHVQVLDRAAIDNIPTGHSIQSIAQLIVGISLSAPDVGGSRASGTQTYMSVHGQGPAQNNVMIDGMPASSIEGNGAVLSNFSDAMNQEMSYQTSGINADRSGGGVTVNMIPREGGNRFSGSGNLAYRPGEWQGDNLSGRLQDLGLKVGSSIEYIFDGNVSQGGPIVKDKLWFFASYSDQASDNRVANTFFDDGRQGTDLNYVRHTLARVTWQVSPRHKMSAFYDWLDKYRGHNMPSLTDPETAALVWTWPNFSTGQLKYTSTVSSKVLLEAGYSFNQAYRNEDGQPGTTFGRFTPGWYAGASRTTQVAGPRTTFPALTARNWKIRRNVQASVSYVTGSHNIKTGFAWGWGFFFHQDDTNGDLTQRYSSAFTDPVTHNVTFQQPVDVLIRNTPLDSRERMNADLGLYAQDSWKIRRLTVNYGLRWESLNSQVDTMTAPPGRFVPARTQPEVRDVPNWKDWAPRLGLVYDLFGDAKTAVKYSVNRYNRAQTTGIAEGFNALSPTTQAVAWTDLNGDDIAQGARTWNADGTYADCVYLTAGCEVNLAGQLRSNFGLLSDVGTYAGFPRLWNVEHGLEIQHELLPRLSVSATWYHWNDHNLTKTVNRALKPGDFGEIMIFNPIDGTPITYYNITAAANTRPTDNVTTVEPSRKASYNGYSMEFRLRPYAGAQLFGGFMVERALNIDCGTSVPGAIVNPNSLRFCDETQNGKPFAGDFRLAGSFPLPWWGLMVSGAYMNNDEGALATTYTFSRAIRYPDGTNRYRNGGGQIVPACPAEHGCVPGAVTAPALTASSATVTLFPPDTLREERLHQLDLKVSKTFRRGRVTIAPTFEVFNTFNADKVITRVSSSYANAAGTFRQPSSIVEGRLIGFGAMVKW